jgi:hypothetical protein
VSLLTKKAIVRHWMKKDMAGYPEVYVQVTSLGNLVCYSHLVVKVQILEKAFFFPSSDLNEMGRDRRGQKG